MKLYICGKCLDTIKKNDSSAKLIDTIANSEADYECDICGGLLPLLWVVEDPEED